MIQSEMISKVTNLAANLHGLMREAEPGLASWWTAVGHVLNELADLAPQPKAERENAALRAALVNIANSAMVDCLGCSELQSIASRALLASSQEGRKTP